MPSSSVPRPAACLSPCWIRCRRNRCCASPCAPITAASTSPTPSPSWSTKPGARTVSTGPSRNRALRLVVGLLQAGDVDLAHLQHRLQDPLRLLGILVLQHLTQRFGDDLPG